MTTTIVSTYTLGQATLSSMARTQNELAKLTVESSSGQYADLGVQLGDQSGYELSLRNQVTQLQALTTANSLTVTNLKTAQTAIDAIRTGAQSAVSSLTAVVAGSADAATSLQNAGTSGLQSLIDQMNVSSNGEYVFGGINSGAAPVADYFSSATSSAKNAIDTAFTTAFGFSPSSSSASTISESAMQSFLSGTTFTSLFSGANWTSDWSSASDTNVSTQTGPGQSTTTSTNANQAGFQQLVQAYAMLTEFGGASLSSGAQQALISTATSLINQGTTSLTGTEATLGAAEARVTDSSTAMSNQLTILQTQVGSLDNVDSEAVATQLSSLSTQLQTAYQLTAQLQKMNLAQYL